MKREWHKPKSKASRGRDKNAGSIFEQRSALARLRAHLRDEVRIGACRAGRDAVFCVFAIGLCCSRQRQIRSHKKGQTVSGLLTFQLTLTLLYPG
ncbi:hypothetical protein B2J69_02945 [Pantoea latae]|uniref:Uncharacterized protein n=1 Tax=Pantoea latae TaxID=1964541 RepID=A0A1V9DQ44_9GAMM|nr:hypothetical protein B2J69_02945 [Pantoea latae]